MNTSVVSAAIIEGNLIIGLSDGSIINCGFVQGPQGLSGPQGPMGATGDNGTDGNTIITVGGTPGNEIGTDGDYAIDNINWRIYGPKSGGVWGKAKEMLPGPENILENGRAPSGGSGGGSMGGSGNSGGGGGIVYTNTVQLTNSTRTSLGTKSQYSIIPQPPSGLVNQEDLNRWAFGEAFGYIDAAIPVATGTSAPTPLPGETANWDGRLWFNPDTLVLYIYDIAADVWTPISEFAIAVVGDDPPADPQKEGALWWCSDADDLSLYIYVSGDWVPAAPPVSLAGVESDILALQTLVDTNITPALAGAVGDIRTLETEAAYLNRSNTFTENNTFSGRVTVDPGREGHEVVTFQQLAEVEQSIDDLQNSGPATLSWIFEQSTSSIPTEGKMTTMNLQPVTGNIIWLSQVPHSGVPKFSPRTEREYFAATSATGQPLITIWDHATSGHRHKFTASVSRIRQTGSGDFEITIGDFVGSSAELTLDSQCWVTVAGFF
jgi:hypothetical protein